MGEVYTPDVKAVAKTLDMERQDVADDLYIILENDGALAQSAETRGVDEEVYQIYLTMKISENAYQAAADVLGVELDEVSGDPSLILNNSRALVAAACVMDMEEDAYEMYLQNVIAQQAGSSEEMNDIQNQVIAGLGAAAEELEELTGNMGLLKSNSAALHAAVTASGIPEEIFLSMIDPGLASNELGLDGATNFNVKNFILMNFDVFLLFAISSISFLASCILIFPKTLWPSASCSMRLA